MQGVCGSAAKLQLFRRQKINLVPVCQWRREIGRCWTIGGRSDFSAGREGADAGFRIVPACPHPFKSCRQERRIRFCAPPFFFCGGAGKIPQRSPSRICSGESPQGRRLIFPPSFLGFASVKGPPLAAIAHRSEGRIAKGVLREESALLPRVKSHERVRFPQGIAS